jgi:hypothetical protein
MKNPDRIDIGTSLTELSDEEAVAIMEGRSRAADDQQLHDAARDLARGVLEEQGSPTSAPGGGGNVVQLIVRQPWMRIAAAVVVGVGLGTLVRAPMEVANLSPATSVASANVVYLETTRSADPADVPTVKLIDGEPWVSFVAYPDFEGAEQLNVEIDRARTPQDQPLAAVRSGEWEIVVSTAAGIGTKDSVVVTVDSALLISGYYRLRIVSASVGGSNFETSHMFLVER